MLYLQLAKAVLFLLTLFSIVVVLPSYYFWTIRIIYIVLFVLLLLKKLFSKPEKAEKADYEHMDKLELLASIGPAMFF